MKRKESSDEIFTVSKLEDSKKKSGFQDFLETLLYLIGALLIAWFVLTFITQRTLVNGSSMFPNLHDGESIMIDKVSYRFTDPERFDIIVFKYNDEKHYIKRIIGLPGETVQIADGLIYIDGELLEEDYGFETIENPGRAVYPITLGEDEYFVLGDNRNGSSDSRAADVGNISRSRIVGRALLRIWPLNRIGILRHQ